MVTSRILFTAAQMGLRRLLALSFRICIYPLARPDRASGHAAVDSFLVLFTVAVGDGRRAATPGGRARR
jgi:hypothetical protein